MAPRGKTEAAPRVRLWPGLSPGVHLGRARPAAFPLGYPNTQMFARARHALWHGLRTAGLERGDEVLTPAYHCGAEVAAVVGAGLAPRFYDASPRLEPDREELEARLSARTRALLLIHYFGFPQELAGWREWCDERGLLLIEDCAQAFCATDGRQPVGSVGDFAVFSFAKTLPLPDGAALVSRAPARADGAPQASLVPVLKRHLQWAMMRSGSLDALFARLERARAGDFELGDPSRSPARATPYLLRRLGGREVGERRRANFGQLLESAHGRVPAPFDLLPPGASPLVFPIDADAEPGLPERLARAGVEARRFWPVAHPLLALDRFPGAAAWRRRLLALPVHQELRSDELARIAAVLR